MVDPNAPTEENEPVRVPARTLPRVVVALIAVAAFMLLLLAVVLVAGGMSLLRR